MQVQRQKAELFKCCGSRSWVNRLASLLPLLSVEAIIAASDKIWFALSEDDWREAFSHHPKIGDMESLKKNFASTSKWASGEQSGVQGAPDHVLSELRSLNGEYERKYGYIFIICATGKTANEMSALLRERLNNNPEEELYVAMKEQNKITHLRLEKLFL